MKIRELYHKSGAVAAKISANIGIYLRLLRQLMQMILPVVMAVLLLNGISIVALEEGLKSSVKSNLAELAEQGAQAVGTKVTGQLEILESLARVEQQNESDHSDEKIRLFLNAESAKWGFEQIGIAYPDGMIVDHNGRSEYIGDRSYFIQAMKGKPAVSDPLVSRMSGNLVIVYAVPESVDGRVKRIIIGTQDAAYLNQLIKGLVIGEDGNTFIKDSEGYTIAHDKLELVRERYNPLIEISRDKSLAELVALERRMEAGEKGAGEYRFMGADKYLGYAPIPGTGWSLAVAAPKASVFKQTNRIVLIASGLMFALALALIGAFAYSSFLNHKYHRSRAIAESAISDAGLFLLTMDMECRIISATANLMTRLGVAQEELRERNVLDFGGFNAEWIRALTQNAQPFLMPLTGVNGDPMAIRWYPVNATLGDTEIIELLGADISETEALLAELNRKNEALEEQNANLSFMEAELQQRMTDMEAARKEVSVIADRYRLAADASRDVIWDWDGRANASFISDRIFEIMGETYRGATWSLDTLHELIIPEDIPVILKDYSDHLKFDTPFFSSEFRVRDNRNQSRWVHIRGIAIKDSEGRVIRTAGSLADVSKQKQQELRLHQLAYYDVLTGLPNGYWLQEKFESLLSSGEEPGFELTLYCVGLDELKRINDLMGNSAGDIILQAVAGRLSGLDAENSEIARIGGDEFILIRKNEGSTYHQNAFGERLVAAVREPIPIKDAPVYITCSVGMARYPQDGQSSDTLLKHVELAMSKAKEIGKNTLVRYDSLLGRESSERTQMSQHLRKAVSRNEFYLEYQPSVQTVTGDISGYEALLRWNSPVYGLVSPDRFIPLAEENGAIIELGMMVLQKVFQFIRRTGRKDIIVSCNVSARQLMQRDFVDTLLAAYQKADVPKNTLAIEITESALLESMEEVVPRIRAIRNQGIPIYLDDFGTGYSSLTYLTNLPIDVIKIDKTFVQKMMQGDREAIIVKTVIGMAHQMGLTVVAEGVETSEQLARLKTMDCDLIQGYFFSRPLSEDAALSMLKHG